MSSGRNRAKSVMNFSVKDKNVKRMVKQLIREAGLEGQLGCKFDDEDENRILDVDDLSQSNSMFSSHSNTFSSDTPMHPAIAAGLVLKDFISK